MEIVSAAVTSRGVLTSQTLNCLSFRVLLSAHSVGQKYLSKDILKAEVIAELFLVKNKSYWSFVFMNSYSY